MRKTALILLAVLVGSASYFYGETPRFDSPQQPPGSRLFNRLAAQFIPPPARTSPTPAVNHGQIISNPLELYEGGNEKLSQRNRTEVIAKRGDIRKELETLTDHPWAGFYAKGLSLGAQWELSIAPESGFAYTCQSTDNFVNGSPLIDHNYGSVTWENGILKLSPVLANDKNEHNHLPTEFVLIRWGDQLCLVPADGIIDFCNGVHSGRGAIYFVRNGRMGMPRPVGKPEVPEKYKPYLLEQPIAGEIIAVGETREIRKRTTIAYETVVTINKGTQDSVLPGMEFFASNPTPIYAPIKLTKVSETESEGIIEQGLHQSMTTGERSIIGGKPQIGWSVSTRFRW